MRGDNRPYPPVPPRQVIPTIQALAANAVMAGCKPEYFPVVTAALRGVLDPDYNLHGTLATTHSCAPMVMVSGPIRQELNINCGTNCFGQGWRANATIGRALGLILLNVAGAKPGEMDRSTQGNPAKFTFCFGENEEENPWAPYHVRRGFAPTDSVVTVMSGEGPHNINDHGSTTGDGLLTTFAGGMAQPGRQHDLRQGPDVRRHRPRACRDAEARRLHDREHPRGAVEALARAPVARLAGEPRHLCQHRPQAGRRLACRSAATPQDIHITVAGGPGKHSAFIPSFGGTTVASVRIAPMSGMVRLAGRR